MLLKMVYYAIAGVLLSSISWSTISHSAVTGDYLLSFILVGMMFYVVGNCWHPAKMAHFGTREIMGRMEVW